MMQASASEQKSLPHNCSVSALLRVIGAFVVAPILFGIGTSELESLLTRRPETPSIPAIDRLSLTNGVPLPNLKGWDTSR
jgi:hypothetical protein